MANPCPQGSAGLRWVYQPQTGSPFPAHPAVPLANLFVAICIHSKPTNNERTGSLACAPMGRRVDVDQLVGASDIKDRLGFTRVQDVHSTRRRDPAFPEPVAFIGGGPQHRILVWYWPDV